MTAITTAAAPMIRGFTLAVHLQRALILISPAGQAGARSLAGVSAQKPGHRRKARRRERSRVGRECPRAPPVLVPLVSQDRAWTPIVGTPPKGGQASPWLAHKTGSSPGSEAELPPLYRD